jgi:hypothetical protein
MNSAGAVFHFSTRHDPATRRVFSFSSEIIFMTPEEEHAIRSQLKWKRDGSDWVLLRGRRRMGRVSNIPGMWRTPKSGGRVSDIANLSWAKAPARLFLRLARVRHGLEDKKMPGRPARRFAPCGAWARSVQRPCIRPPVLGADGLPVNGRCP